MTKYIGNSYPIHDAVQKATGKPLYAGDMILPGMVYLVQLACPLSHAKVVHIDIEEALRVPGVIAIFHCGNTPQRAYNQFRSRSNQEAYADCFLFPEEIRFSGERVAAVAAKTKEIAESALKLIHVEYEPLPASFEAKSESQKLFSDDVKNEKEMNIGEEPDRSDLFFIDSETSMSRITHLAMENYNCVADYSDMDGILKIWSPNQSVFGVRTVIADLLALPYNRVRVIKTTMGGSFGSKQEWITEPLAAYAAFTLKCPVKFCYSRKESISSSICRHPIHSTTHAGFTRDGFLKILEVDSDFDAGAHIGNSLAYAVTMGTKLFRTYHYPYAHYHSSVFRTNTIPSGGFRGWGAPEFAFIIECCLDRAARMLGIDRVKIRLLNVAKTGDFDPIENLTLGEVKLTQCLTEGAKRFGWEQRQKKKQTEGRFRTGIGVACAGHVNGYYPRLPDFGSVIVWINEDGTIQADIPIHDHGCGTVTAMKLLLAETLSIPPESIFLSEADTWNNGLDTGCYSSRTVFVLGRAVVDCANKVKALLLERAAEMLHCQVSQLSIDNAVVFSSDGRSLTYKQVSEYSLFTKQEQISIYHSYQSHSNPAANGVHFAEVVIDTFTGIVSVKDYLAIHDIGCAINREICVSQIQGAVQMGIGAAISERLTVDKQGSCTNSLKNYHVVNAPDMPTVQVEFLEGDQNEGPYGAKSIGEVAFVPVSSAVLSAINDALQSDFGRIPVTPEDILAFLDQKVCSN